MQTSILNRIKKNKEIIAKLKENEKKYKKLVRDSLKEKNEIKKLNRKLLIEQENDRKEISRELHDETSQILTSINFDLAVLAKIASKSEQRIRDKIAATHELIIKSVDTIHNFSKKLRPMELDDLGLLPAIKALINDFIKCTKIKITLEAKVKFNKLSELQKTVLYRILQESLTNAVRHANARSIQIKVHFSKKNSSLKMQIQDNGKIKKYKDLLQKKSLKGIGLIGMQERAKLINGQLSVVSRPGVGTTVLVLVPMQASDVVVQTKS
jgi:two-component system sensor histidine kinase UhpB